MTRASTHMPAQQGLLVGPAGTIEFSVLHPSQALKGIALVAHPHPLYGGAPDHKVVQTLARTLRDLGYVAFCPSFRGVGKTQGEHDQGEGETDDLQLVIEAAQSQFGHLPLILAGFSFGAYVQTRLLQRLELQKKIVHGLILVGTAVGHVEGLRHYATPAVPNNALVIHGNHDQIVPLENVLSWAEPLEVPVVIIPGADHFFHRKLHILRRMVHNYLGGI
jgi:alpha/beta superfamily hydrolase